MKTIHKKSNSKSGRPPDKSANIEHKWLVEDPDSHHLLSYENAETKSNFISSLIAAKKDRIKKRGQNQSLFASMGFCLSMLFVIGMFEMNFKDAVSTVSLSPVGATFNETLEIPPTEQKAPPPPNIAAPKIVEVSNDEQIKQDIKVNLDIEMTQETKIEDVVVNTNTEEMPEEKADEIFTIVEEQPSPVGGMQAFYDFVSHNLNYPSRATRAGIEGRVFVQFVVEKDGSLTDIKVVKGIGGGCDEEAVRVISTAPKWKPGKQRGRPVRVRMIMPISFKLLT